MRKITVFICACHIFSHSFSQSLIVKDSIKSSSGLRYKIVENNQAEAQPGLLVYPNPAKNKITLQVKNFDPGMVSVKVLDMKGKPVREDNRLLTNGTEDIIMFLMLKSGIYFILVSEPKKQIRKKLVIL